MANNLDAICRELLGDIAEAVAVSVVDLDSGLILASAHNAPYFTEGYVDTVAAASVDMFRGKMVQQVEKLMGAQRGRDARHSIKEMQMSTDHTYHFFSIVPGKPDALVVMVTSRKVNLGLGWASLRTSLPRIAPHCP